MGREFKIGLAVVGTVAIAFCGILYQRVNKLKTTQTVAANESAATGKTPKADKLFAASQLDTAPADASASTSDRGFRWNSSDREPPAAATASDAAAEPVAAKAAPPRASFMPQDEPASDDRYGSRYTDADVSAPPAATATDAASANETPADGSTFGHVVADTPNAAAPAEVSPSASASEQPSASANPFARNTPGEASPATEPRAAEPAVTEPTTADALATESEAAAPNFVDASIEPATQPPAAVSQPASEPQSAEVAEVAETPINQPSSIAIEQPKEQPLPTEPAELAMPAEPAAPARLDPQAIPTGAISQSPRPASRFISPEEETPPASAGSRYSDAFNEPAPRPRVPAASSAGSPIAGGTYKLGPNENFWTVSERAYGSGGYFKALHAYNAERYPIADELAVGDEIRVPDRAELERQFPSLCPKPGRRSSRDSYAMQASARLKATGRTYVVQEGDTLFDIARYELGKAARWAELYELNREVVGSDIDFLRPGMELILPNDDTPADSLTREPGGTLR